MKTEETKDNGSKREGIDFGCCDPEAIQKMFERCQSKSSVSVQT